MRRQMSQPVPYSAGIPGRHDVSVLAVDDQLGSPRGRSCDHWQATRHGFCHSVTKSFRERRMNQHARFAIYFAITLSDFHRTDLNLRISTHLLLEVTGHGPASGSAPEDQFAL